MFACTVYVSFPKSVHPKSDGFGLPLSIMSKKTLLCWQYINRYGPFYPKTNHTSRDAYMHHIYAYIYIYGLCVYIYIYTLYILFIHYVYINNLTTQQYSLVLEKTLASVAVLKSRTRITPTMHLVNRWTLPQYIWWIGSLSVYPHDFHGKKSTGKSWDKHSNDTNPEFLFL